MSQHSRYIGWCLLLASSLAWFGCNQLSTHSADPATVARNQLPAPESAPPLQIPNTPPAAPAAPVSEPAALQEPTQPTRPAPSAQAPGDQVPLAVKPGQSVSEIPEPEPPLAPANRPTLLPPLSQRMPTVPQASPPAPQKDAVAPMQNPATAPLRTLYRLAAERLATTPAYIARFRRRELFDGKQRPEELILFKYRSDPASFYMLWLGAEAKNRELMYVKGRYNDMLNVVPGVNDYSGLTTNGRRAILRADSAEGLGKERHPVAETGVGALIERFGRLVDAVERGNNKIGTVKYLGPVKRPEFDAQVDAVMHTIPPGVDPGLPKGGQRLWYFDTTLRFPVLVITHDTQGQEAEYYCFDRFLFPGRIQDEEFNPANLGKR